MSTTRYVVRFLTSALPYRAGWYICRQTEAGTRRLHDSPYFTSGEALKAAHNQGYPDATIYAGWGR